MWVALLSLELSNMKQNAGDFPRKSNSGVLIHTIFLKIAQNNSADFSIKFKGFDTNSLSSNYSKTNQIKQKFLELRNRTQKPKVTEKVKGFVLLYCLSNRVMQAKIQGFDTKISLSVNGNKKIFGGQCGRRTVVNQTKKG